MKSYSAPKADEITLSVCIVNYNTRDLLKNCLISVFAASEDVALELIVVDNASSDGSANMVSKEFPEVNLICNRKNRFFAPAMNQALAIGRGRYVLLLNSDTVVFPNCLKILTAFLKQHPDAGACGGCFVDEDGNPLPEKTFWPQHRLSTVFFSCEAWRWIRVKIGCRPDPVQHPVSTSSVQEVEVISGSMIAARYSALREVGFFDEKMLLYWTDDDLALRLRKSGWKLYCCRDAKVFHAFYQTSKEFSPLEIRKIGRRDVLHYWRKHYGGMAWLFVWLVTTFMDNGFVYVWLKMRKFRGKVTAQS